MINEPIALGPQTGCDRQQKHLDLHESIESMREMPMRLESLIVRITGEGPRKDDTCDRAERTQPCLFHVLEGGGTEIRAISNQTHELISKLEELIF